MNSALKPVLTTSGPQNPPVASQLTKSMHPQSTPSTYGQPSAHMPQSLVNLPHSNPNAAHSHPNPAHQTNHYSLNVPNAPQHYTSGSPSAIPASNHPVPSVNQAIGQAYSASKNISYPGGYQPNLGHPPNPNLLPPVSQTLPATQPQHLAPPADASADKPQANGTSDVKSLSKSDNQENHVPLSKDKPAASSAPPTSATSEKSDEKSATHQTPEQKSQEPESVKVPEVAHASLPTAESAIPEPTMSSSGTAPETASAEPEKSAAESKADNEGKSEKTKPEGVNQKQVSEVTPTTTNAESTQNSPTNKTNKEKEQQPSPSKTATTPKASSRKSKTSRSEGDSPKSTKAVGDSKSAPAQKLPTVLAKSKRTRIKTQPYQSPLPEIEIITKISSSAPKPKNNDEKLIVFYKNEFLAVRNSEGSFYICQAVQNIYKSSPKIRIRWLSQDKNEKSGEVYTPDFYDNTDFDCILTNLNLERVDKGKYRLPPSEKERTDSILKRSLAVEKGEVTSPSLTEEHPDGIDLSLYKEESQLKKRKATKRKASASLKASKKVDPAVKSPDQPKARKISPRTAKRAPLKKTKPVAKKAPVPQVEPKKVAATSSTSTSRTDRVKRRHDNQNHNKVSPVVDYKKARVLAKVARKTIATADSSTSSKNQTLAKSSKAVKVTPSSSKSQKPPQKAPARKTKRSLRK